jgi:hypothetical protein
MTLPSNPLAADLPVFTRAATATGLDVNGTTMTFPFNHPAWTWRNGAPALLLADVATPNILYHPWKRDYTSMSGLISFNQSGSMASAGDGWWYLGPEGEQDTRIWIDSSGTVYRLRLDNGSSAVVSVLSTAPVAGNAVVFRWELFPNPTNYSVRIHQSINGGAWETGSTSSTLEISEWDPGMRVYYGTLGGQSGAAVELKEDIIQAGQLSLAQMLQVF